MLPRTLQYILFLGVAFLSVSCSENISDSKKITILNPDEATSEPLSAFISEFEYIKLDTDQTSYIGNIEKIKAYKDRLYILDDRISNALYVYDYDGNLDYKIARYGRGPGEFLGPYDFVIDGDEIIIFDAGGLKLSYFNLEDGSFIKDVNLDFRFARFTSFNDGYIFFLNNITTSEGGDNILVTDKDLNITGSELKINPNMINYVFSLPSNFSRYQDRIYLTAPSDDQIYRFDYNTGNLENHLFIDFGNAALPDSYFGNHPNIQSRRDEIGDSAYNISSYFESDDFYFFRYSRGARGTHYYFKSKLTEAEIHTTQELYEDDLNMGPLPLWPMAIVDHTLIWYSQPSAMLRYVRQKQEQMDETEWSHFKEENQKLISFSESIAGDDNPYLLLTKIEI